MVYIFNPGTGRGRGRGRDRRISEFEAGLVYRYRDVKVKLSKENVGWRTRCYSLQ